MRDKIKLVSTADTGHFYTTTKNKRTMPDKMVIKKYDPVVRKYVEYKEAKIKQLMFNFVLKKPALRAFFCTRTYACVCKANASSTKTMRRKPSKRALTSWPLMNFHTIEFTTRLEKLK